jgi:hypothetical protein
MAAEAPKKGPYENLLTYGIKQSIEGVVFNKPTLYSQNIYELLQTALFREKGDGLGKIMRQLFTKEGSQENPLLKLLLKYPNQFNGTKDSEHPIIWIVVPFQTNGKDGRDEHRRLFIEEMKKVRTYLLSLPPERACDLRIRFCRQVFSCYRRSEPHPIAEKAFYEDPELFTPKFNRGLLLNVGISTITKGKVIYTHDVDLVPGNEISYEAYSSNLGDDIVLHLAGGWDRYNKEGKEGTYLGGIAGMTPIGWRAVDGYPNDYFGWGGEDDEYLRRIKEKGVKIDSTYYDKDKFVVKDLEGIKDVSTKRKIVGTKEADNVVKQELMELYKKGLRKGGISTSNRLSRIINHIREDDWIDIIDIVILPDSYTKLEAGSYSRITYEDSRKDIYRESLYAYKMLNASIKDWSKSDMIMDEKETSYYNMRLPIEVYDETKGDPPEVRRYRDRFTKLARRKYLRMDNIGAYSVSYPETGEQMAIIMASIVGVDTGVIDGTACIGGNTGYLGRLFKRVVGIEINPYRADLVVDNLRRVFLYEMPEAENIRRGKSLMEVVSPSYLDKHITILDGDSQEILLPKITTSQLMKCKPLGRALFVDPPWGGPGYGYAAKKIGLEMTTRRHGSQSAAEYLLPIVRRAIMERSVIGVGAGILSELEYIFMKVPENYNEEELEGILGDYMEIYPKIPIPDRTLRNRVYLITMRIKGV